MLNTKKILKNIKPNAECEKAELKFISLVIARLKKEIRKANIVLAGSFAKGTFLECDKDIDIFVLFKHNVKKEDMKNIVCAAVKNVFPDAFFQIAYAQHPYVRVFTKRRKIDVVPAYEINSESHFELKTAVDRSQLHTRYILSKMSEEQKDEVRLLKKFLKVNFLYGAEIKVQGFSGYLCELLILKYGTFEKTINAIAKWKEYTFIDIENKTEKDNALMKFGVPLMVIDPIDANRNVSAVVSIENYKAIILLARAFCKSKNKLAFFTKKNATRAQLANFLKKKNIYCISFIAPNIIDDVLWGQVRRFYSALRSAIEKEGFEITGYILNRCGENICILLELFKDKLPLIKILRGPPLKFVTECKKFSSKYRKSIFIKNKRLMARVKRDVHTLEEFFFRIIKKFPIPSHLNSVKNAKIYKNTKIIENCKEVLQQYTYEKDYNSTC